MNKETVSVTLADLHAILDAIDIAAAELEAAVADGLVKEDVTIMLNEAQIITADYIKHGGQQ